MMLKKIGNMRWLNVIIFAVIIIFPLLTKGQDDAFTASVSQKQVGVNERFKVTFQLNGKGSNFQPPDFQFFNVLFGPSTSTQVKIINGNYSRTQSYSFKLKPKRKGKFEIGSAKVDLQGKTVKTQPVTIKVVEKNNQKNQSSSSSIAEKIRNRLYIECEVDKPRPYQGEQITATYKLYIGKLNVGDYEVKDVPQFNGFWREIIKEPKRLNVKREVIDGKRYKTAILKKVALFPQEYGELTLDPFKMQFRVQYRDPNQRRRGFFGGGYESKTLMIKSDPIAIDVKPLPDNQPSSFTGLVGSFDMNSSLSKEQTMTNDPVSLKIHVRGNGNLNLLQPFELDLPPVFENYSPDVHSNLNTKNNTVSGHKKFEYIMIPRSPGQYKIDPVEFSYFDPNKEQYVTHTTPRHRVRVNQGAGGPDSAALSNRKPPSQKDVKVMNKDVRYIQSNPGSLEKGKTGFVFSGGFWGLTITPFFLLGGLVYYQRKRSQIPAQPLNAKAKKAEKTARKKLKTAKKHWQKGDQEGFFEALSEAMWGYAGDKMDIAMAEMTQEHIREVFQQKGIEEDQISQFLQIINSCEQARFAPSLGNFDMGDLYRKSETVISTIESQLS